MLRGSFLALTFVIATPALASTQDPNTLSAEGFSLRLQTDLSVGTHLTGVPKSWERFRGETDRAGRRDICDSIRNAIIPDAKDLPFDASSVLTQALGQDFCTG